MPTAGEEIEKLKRWFRVSLDQELAAALGVDPSTISTWRRRGSVPPKYVLIGQSLADSELASYKAVFGAGYLPVRQAYVFRLIAHVVRHLDATFSLGDDEQNEMWQGFKLAALHRYLDQAFDYSLDRPELRARFEHLRSEIDRADSLPEWLESLPQP